jgi:hypothetical protein
MAGDLQENSAALLWLLRGDAAQRVIVSWNMGWAPAHEASGKEWIAPFLAETLDKDTYSAVRYVAHQSLRQLPGFENFEYDFVAPADDRSRARQRVHELWNSRDHGDIDVGSRARLLLHPSGGLQEDAVNEYLRQRDDRRIFIFE